MQPRRNSGSGMHRLLRHWTLGLAMYVVSLGMLWVQAWLGAAPQREVAWLTAVSLAGVFMAYAAIRASARLRLAGALLNTCQCVFAVTCVMAAYALVGPMRGVTLSILVVVLVFGGFLSSPRQMRAMCVFAVTGLGLTILWKSLTDSGRYPAREELVHFILATTMLVAVAYLAEWLSRLRKTLTLRTQDLADALARIEDMAARDELTQLINRRQMVETLRHEGARRQRSGEPVCIAVIDIDHFKDINDSLGHAAGDEVLKRFATQALGAVRGSDVLSRWGGEEFLLMLPATRLDAARAVLERMRAEVRESARITADPALRVTFSAGLVESAPEEPLEAAIEVADKAMYRAKREGRDRIACVTPG